MDEAKLCKTVAGLDNLGLGHTKLFLKLVETTDLKTVSTKV